MERSVYVVEERVEQSHWWFVGRRRLFSNELAKARVIAPLAILDIGSGTGANLRLLRKLGFVNVTGLDNSQDAIQFCENKGLGPIQNGDICALPFADGSFDLILATDVIEHVDDDDLALREIARVLKPTGKALITVPAFNCLWGLQDRVGHHRRRYRQYELRTLVGRTGLRVIRMFYFNYLLFVPIWLVRRAIDILGIELESEGQLNAPWLNLIFSAIFRFDVWTAPIIRPPVGVSIFALLEKKI